MRGFVPLCLVCEFFGDAFETEVDHFDRTARDWQNGPILRWVEWGAFPKQIRCLALKGFFAERKHESKSSIGRSPKMHRAGWHKDQGRRLYAYLLEIYVQQARTGPHVEDLIEIMPMRPAAGPGIAETL